MQNCNNISKKNKEARGQHATMLSLPGSLQLIRIKEHENN